MGRFFRPENFIILKIVKEIETTKLIPVIDNWSSIYTRDY